jgi:hypothetical protein
MTSALASQGRRSAADLSLTPFNLASQIGETR